MLYLYPLFQFGTVSLTHYNLWIDEMRDNDFYLPYQRLAGGFGLGMGVRVSLLEIDVEPSVLYTSSSGGDRRTSGRTTLYFYRKHSLLNFVLALPVGISYSLTETFRLFAGGRMLIGFSNLSVYDSTHLNVLGVHTWTVRDASMSSSSVGMGFSLGGDLKVSDKLTLYTRIGYDALTFSGYTGKYEDRASDGNTDRGAAYWVFDTDDNALGVSDSPPDEDKNEIYAEEDLNGVRFSVGLKFFLGR